MIVLLEGLTNWSAQLNCTNKAGASNDEPRSGSRQSKLSQLYPMPALIPSQLGPTDATDCE
jgi:hypothetical protein